MKTSLTSVSQPVAAPTNRFAGAAGPRRGFRAALLGGIALLASAGAATAQELPSVMVKQTDTQALSFTIENPAKEVLRMQVRNLNNNTCLISEASQELSYGRRLNFRNLPNGKYAVLLSIGRERYRYTVQVQSQTQTTISVAGLTAPDAPQAIAAVVR